ncbi:MAG: lysoplasmalogenase [Parvularculaceae bacterium]
MSVAAFVLVSIAACAGLLIADYLDEARLRAIFKPVASLAFIGAALAAGALQSPMGTALLAGLVLSAAGDVLLIPRGDRFFLAGVAAFALGHLAYSGAFLIGGLRFGLEAASAAGLTLGAGLFFVGPMRARMGALATPVGVYVLIISAMVGLSLAHYAGAPSARSLQLAIGAAAFAASDLAVARDRFGKSDFLNRAWGLPLYYGAQLLIATAV